MRQHVKDEQYELDCAWTRSMQFEGRENRRQLSLTVLFDGLDGCKPASTGKADNLSKIYSSICMNVYLRCVMSFDS